MAEQQGVAGRLAEIESRYGRRRIFEFSWLPVIAAFVGAGYVAYLLSERAGEAQQSLETATTQIAELQTRMASPPSTHSSTSSS